MQWFACLILLSPIAHTQEETLRWKFAAGEKFSHEIVSKINQTIKIGEQEFKQDVAHTIVCAFEVLSVEKDGSVILQERIESVKANTSQGAPVPSPAINQFQGVTFKITLSPDAKLLKLEGYDELLRKVAGEDPNSIKVVQAMMSEAQIKQLIESSFSFLPEKAVARNASWELNSNLTFGPLGSVAIQRQLTLHGPESDQPKVMRINITPKIKYEAPKPEATNSEFSVQSGEMQLENSTGFLLFDTANGKLSRSELKLTMNGILNVKFQDKAMPVKMQQTQTVEVRMGK